MRSVADLRDRLRQLHARTAETPLFNPVFQLSLDLSRELESGDLSLDQIEGMISAVDSMLSDMTDVAATLGATNSRLEMQDEFVADLMDVIDTGVGRLVDADMNEESTRLKALQTQQQLGIQALSIANSSAQNVLSLFK